MSRVEATGDRARQTLRRFAIFYLCFAVLILLWSFATYLFRRTYMRPLADEGAEASYLAAVEQADVLGQELFWPAAVGLLVSIVLAIAVIRVCADRPSGDARDGNPGE